MIIKDDKLFNVLVKIGENFNNANILWGVGGSLLLKKYNLIQKVNDIDIIVDYKDINKVIQIMNDLGEFKETKPQINYGTKKFLEYTIDGIDIDIMSVFIIKNPSFQYEFYFDKRSITNHDKIGHTIIPYTSLEDWYVAYMLMEGREEKTLLIEEYLYKNGIKHKELIERAIKQDIPLDEKDRIKKLIFRREL